MRKALCIIALAASFCMQANAGDIASVVKADSCGLYFPAGRARMERFLQKVRACSENPDSSATVWHVGGSHVQAGWFSSRMRHHFDSLSAGGGAGRGFIFPYPLAYTNYDHSYNVSREGSWTGSLSANPNRKLHVQPRFGILGIAAWAADSTAAFGLGTPDKFSRLHIMGEGSDESVTPLVICGRDSLCCVPDTLLNGFLAVLPEETDSLKVEIPLSPGQGFMLTGLLPEHSGTGVRYISTGVNGARTTTWTDRCPEFRHELGLIRPDLVVFGLGINDSACPESDFNPERFKRNYRRLIDMVLEDSPECAIVFVTNNDSWRWSRRRMVHNGNGEAVRRAMFELAVEYRGAVWDLFGLMGGNGSATRWRDAGLMKQDRLHFTREGYELLGDLLFQAIIESGS